MERFNTALLHIAEDAQIEPALNVHSTIKSIGKTNGKINDLERDYTYFEIRCEWMFKRNPETNEKPFLMVENQIIVVRFKDEGDSEEKYYICYCKDPMRIEGTETGEGQVKAIPIFFNESILKTYKTNINSLNDDLKNKLDELSNLIGTNVESQVVSDE